MHDSFGRGLLILLFLAGNLHLQPALAQGTNVEEEQPPASSMMDNKRSDIQKLNSLAHSFHQIHVSANRLKRICKSINDEFNRTSLKILTFDEYINQYIDGKPVAYNEQLYPYGFQNIGNTSTTAGDPLPPRREYVTHFVTEAKSLTSLIKEEINSSVDALGAGNFEDSISAMTKSLKDANVSLAVSMNTLGDLSIKESYDKDAVINACSELSTKLSELDSTCKLTMKMVSASRRK